MRAYLVCAYCGCVDQTLCPAIGLICKDNEEISTVSASGCKICPYCKPKTTVVCKDAPICIQSLPQCASDEAISTTDDNGTFVVAMSIFFSFALFVHSQAAPRVPIVVSQTTRRRRRLARRRKNVRSTSAPRRRHRAPLIKSL